MSPEGRLDTNPVEGYVTVTDNPDRQRAINTYISKINEKTGKKIAIRVDVYDVQNGSGGNFGIDSNAIIKALSGQFSWVSAPMASVDGGNDKFGQFSFTQKNGSRSVFNALNTIGKTTQVTGTTIYTISGQPSPVQNSIQTNYLKSITNTITNGVTSSSAETGTINTGYSMMITPRIESNNQVLISLNLQISNLVSIDSYPIGGGSGSHLNIKGLSVGGDSNGQTIQLPVVHTKNFLQNMILKSGQSILIAGFQDGDTNIKTNSMGDPSMWILGGSKATSQTKSTTVVVVTPYLIS